MNGSHRPTLLSNCSLATTAAEARFRVEYPNSRTRSSRIFALDQRAAEAMYAITEDPWQGAHFLTVLANDDIEPEATEASKLPLTHPDGTPADLAVEIEGADVAVLISSSGRNAGAAEVIAREAYHRSIMIAGMALSDLKGGQKAEAAVNAMRPFASVLVVARDEDFIPAMLNALRA